MAVLRSLRRAEPDLGFAAIVAFGLAFLAFLLQGSVGLHLREDGFLWYGAVQTLAGEVPLRDFRSYDPGRYYWCAAWMKVLGEGILSLRLACAVFQGLGLTCGLLAARRAIPSRWLLVPIGMLLLLWMLPTWKLFDSSLAMAAVFFGVRLVERPDTSRHAAAGCFVTLAGFFGRNHGFYALVAMGVLIVLVHAKGLARGLVRDFGAFAAGGLVGLAPFLAMIALVPGFLDALGASIRFYIEQESLNAPLPVPWPWTLPLDRLGSVKAVESWGFAVCYAMLPLVCAFGIGLAFLSRATSFPRRSLLTACGIVGAVYVHHVSVRSDVLHLAECIHPAWIGLIAIPGAVRAAGPGRTPAWIVAGALLLAGATIGRQGPLASKLLAGSGEKAYSRVEVAGDRLWLDPTAAFLVERVPEVVDRLVPEDESIWISSQLLALYVVLGRRCPVWDVYPAWKASERRESRMLAELAGVRWVLHIDEHELNEGMGLQRTHPRVWRTLQEEFEEVPIPRWPSNFRFLRRKRP